MNRKNKALAFVLIVTMLSMLAVGCSNQAAVQSSAAAPAVQSSEAPAVSSAAAPASSTPAAEGKKKVIGLVQIDLQNPFHLGEVEGAKEAARRNGFDLEVTSGEGDVTKQVKAFDNLIEKGVDAISVNCIDVNAFKNSFQKAKDKGIPVVVLHSKAEGTACTVGFDEYKLSTEVGEYAIKLLKAKNGSEKGKVALLAGMLGQGLNTGRTGGFLDVMKKYPDIKVVAAEPTDWDGTKATAIMENYLTTYPDLDLIFGLSDSVTYPAANVIKNASKRNQILITSVDGSDYALEAIKNGEMDSSYLLAAEYAGYVKAYVPFLCSQGKTFTEDYIISGVIVTKDNVDSIIKLANAMKNDIQNFPFDKPLPDLIAQYK
jgi:ribose transport system substrate-binding protein